MGFHRHHPRELRHRRLDRRAVRPALVALALSGALSAPASAQLPTPTPPAEQPAAPAATTLSIKAAKLHRLKGRSYELAGSTYRVTGRLQPAAAGEDVVVRFKRGKSSATRTVETDAQGRFAVPFRARGSGRVRITAEHPQSAGFAASKAKAIRVVVLRTSLGGGGPLVRLYQRGLDRLGYRVPRNGRHDDGTRRATMAFRKVNRMARTFSSSPAIVRRVLAGKGAYRVRYPKAGRHVEADISRQVLALIDGDKVVATYHTSTGAPATPTILGRYRVYRKDPGTNSLGMVHSSYFIRGYAIHGYSSVPPYNASHGCLRVPVPDAWRIYNWVRMGTTVITYR